MNEKEKNRSIDKNFFKEMNYEIAAENGVIDNEEMKNNKSLNVKSTRKDISKK